MSNSPELSCDNILWKHQWSSLQYHHNTDTAEYSKNMKKWHIPNNSSSRGGQNTQVSPVCLAHVTLEKHYLIGIKVFGQRFGDCSSGPDQPCDVDVLSWTTVFAACRLMVWLSVCLRMNSLQMQIESCRNHLVALAALQTLARVSGVSSVRQAHGHCLMRKRGLAEPRSPLVLPPPPTPREPGKQITVGHRDLPNWQNFISGAHRPRLPRQRGALSLARWWCTDTATACPFPSAVCFPDRSRIQGHRPWLVGLCGMWGKHFLLLGILACTVIYLCFTSPGGVGDGWKRHYSSSSQADHPEKHRPGWALASGSGQTVFCWSCENSNFGDFHVFTSKKNLQNDRKIAQFSGAWERRPISQPLNGVRKARWSSWKPRGFLFFFNSWKADIPQIQAFHSTVC